MQIMFSRIVKSTFLNTSMRNLSTKLEKEFRFCTLEDSRALLRLSGRDVKSFLQGLITNDIDHLGHKVGSSIYAALLNPRGRVAHDLIVYRDQESKSGIDVFVLDCDRQSIDRCIKTFKKYVMRSNVEMEDISTTHRVCCVIGSDQIEEMTHCLDPRLSSLGLRFISHKDRTNEMEMRYRGMDPAEYKSWRVQHGVAEGQGEIPNDALPLEYNMDALNGISFSKGCYIGQELTARTHFQGVIRKRLMPGYLPEAQNHVQIGAEVRLQPEDKTVGQIRAVVQDHVLMILRVQAAVDAELVQSRQLTLEGKELTPLFPLWWPREWRQSIS